MIGKLMGIDHGLSRIGIAISDALGISATERLIIDRTSKQADFAIINQLAQEENIVAFIIGVPYSDAPEGVFTQADKVRNWIGYFQETTPLPIITWDESLTSDEAREIARIQKRAMTDPIDDLAARVILQSYLDAVKDGTASPPLTR